MKNVIMLSLMLISYGETFSQIKHITTLDASSNIIELEQEGLKYFKIHRKSNTIVLYNLNSTVFKIIKLDLPVLQRLDQVKSISKYQFNSDELIEIAFTTYLYESNEHEMGYSEMKSLTFTLTVTNEKGKELLSVPGASHFEVLRNNSDKVLVVIRDTSNSKFSGVVSEIYTVKD